MLHWILIQNEKIMLHMCMVNFLGWWSVSLGWCFLLFNKKRWCGATELIKENCLSCDEKIWNMMYCVLIEKENINYVVCMYGNVCSCRYLAVWRISFLQFPCKRTANVKINDSYLQTIHSKTFNIIKMKKLHFGMRRNVLPGGFQCT